MTKFIRLNCIFNEKYDKSQIFNINMKDYNNIKENLNKLVNENYKIIKFNDEDENNLLILNNDYHINKRINTLELKDLNYIDTIIINTKYILDLQLYDCKNLKNIIIYNNNNIDIIYDNCPLKTIKYIEYNNNEYRYTSNTYNDITYIYETI